MGSSSTTSGVGGAAGGGSGILNTAAVLSALYGNSARICNAYLSLNPVEISVPFEECRIYCVGFDGSSDRGGGGAVGGNLGSMLLPVGQSSQLDPTCLCRIVPEKENELRLLHSLLAVSHCPPDDEGQDMRKGGDGNSAEEPSKNSGVAEKTEQKEGQGKEEEEEEEEKDISSGDDSGNRWEDPEFSHRILRRNTAGFVYLRAIDWESRSYSFLSPCSGPLPSQTLIMGSIKWFDE